MRRIQKYLSGLCAAALLLSLLLAGTAKADEITIYLMAENDQMLDLPLSAMPAWINGDIYVPYTAFDWTVTGVNLGVSYGQERTETEYKFTLYSLNGMLVFDLNAGTCTDGFSGEAKDMRAALRNGRVFVPLAGVCSFFWPELHLYPHQLRHPDPYHKRAGAAGHPAVCYIGQRAVYAHPLL